MISARPLGENGPFREMATYCQSFPSGGYEVDDGQEGDPPGPSHAILGPADIGYGDPMNEVNRQRPSFWDAHQPNPKLRRSSFWKWLKGITHA